MCGQGWSCHWPSTPHFQTELLSQLLEESINKWLNHILCSWRWRLSPPAARSCPPYRDSAPLPFCWDWNVLGLTWQMVVSGMGKLEVFCKEGERWCRCFGKALLMFFLCRGCLNLVAWSAPPVGQVLVGKKYMNKGVAAARQSQVEVCRLVLLHTRMRTM